MRASNHLVTAFAAPTCYRKPGANIRKNCPNNALAQREAVSIIRRDFPPWRRLEQNMSEEAKATELLPLVTDIVAAHLSNNNVPSNELPQLIREVYQALAAASGGGPAPKERPAPAVSIKKSITPEYIICLEDGKKLKMLKRHLRTAYNLSPEQYRERWDLPADYPMVAPNYAKKRSHLAKKIGLGTKSRRRRK